MKKKLGLFDSCFLKLLLRTVFENTVNTILVFSENYSYSLNFSFLYHVFRKKKFSFCVFIVFIVFQNKKQFSKTVNKQTNPRFNLRKSY